jgi:hypothetical protein
MLLILEYLMKPQTAISDLLIGCRQLEMWLGIDDYSLKATHQSL